MSAPNESRASSGSGPARRSISRALIAHILTDAGMVVGGALALAAVTVLIRNDGGLAYDTHAYWLAARHLLDGSPLYVRADYSSLGIYTYPPIFAQLFAPAALLPELLVAWIWRIATVLCLRYLVGSWKATIVACAFIPVLTELSLGNVTLPIAVVLMWALRDRRGAYLLPWAAALKFGPALLVPYLWFRMPEARRPLVIGTVIFAVACLVSFAIAPGSWSAYFEMLGWQNSAQLEGSGVIHLISGSGGLDFVVRFGLAAVAVLFATRTRRAWLAYAAASITCPVLAVGRLAPLVGLWRFWRFRRSADTEGLPAGPDATVPDAKP
jgi:hypothetical protein